REWMRILAARMAEDKLFNLDTINLGFIRPKSSDDWTLAYCQAELYAEFMLSRYGSDALAKMLKAYADNLDTRAALQRSFHVQQDDFEKAYRDYLQQLVAAQPASKPAASMDFAALVKAQQDAPENPDLAARLALEFLKRKMYPRARELAEAALQ